MTIPNPRPNRQNRIPISSSLWPSIRPLRKLTEDRSGSFKLASPPTSWAGCANAAAAVNIKMDVKAAVFLMRRHPWDAILASKVRII